MFSTNYLIKDVFSEILKYIKIRNLGPLAQTNKYLHSMCLDYLNEHSPNKTNFKRNKHHLNMKSIYLCPDDLVEDFQQAYLKNLYYDSITFVCLDGTYILRAGPHTEDKTNRIYKGDSFIPSKNEEEVSIKDFYKNCTDVIQTFNKFAKCCFNCAKQDSSNIQCTHCMDTFQVCLDCFKPDYFVQCDNCGCNVEPIYTENCTE